MAFFSKSVSIEVVWKGGFAYELVILAFFADGFGRDGKGHLKSIFLCFQTTFGKGGCIGTGDLNRCRFCLRVNKLNYFIFDTHLPAVVIPAQAGIHRKTWETLIWKTVSEFKKWITAVACPRVGGGRNDGIWWYTVFKVEYVCYIEMGGCGAVGFDYVGASLK